MSRPTILVVDDEAAIHRFLTPVLNAEGYHVVQAKTGGEALRLVADLRPDILVLDLGLPDLDGKAVIATIRLNSDVPIVVLSARDREAEKVEALDLGADDFVNKPFGVGELTARLRAALRYRGPAGTSGFLTAGSVTLDTKAHLVHRAGAEVKLTRREFAILEILLQNAGRVVTHRQLLRAVWGPANEHDTQYLRVYIGHLRAKLEDDPAAPSLILTEPGIGYRLDRGSADGASPSVGEV